MAITSAPTTQRLDGLSRPVDTELVARAHELRERAEHLRTQAAAVSATTANDLLATTYRRRAAELELEAWASEVRSGLPLDAITAIAA
jgi:hypothetical protein